MLAVAEPDLFRLRQVELLRAKTGALVAAITVRLMPAQAARTPPVVSGWQFDGNRLFLVNFGKVFHGAEFGRSIRKVKAAWMPGRTNQLKVPGGPITNALANSVPDRRQCLVRQSGPRNTNPLSTCPRPHQPASLPPRCPIEDSGSLAKPVRAL